MAASNEIAEQTTLLHAPRLCSRLLVREPHPHHHIALIEEPSLRIGPTQLVLATTTSQFDFTNNEWNDIAVLPVLVGFAVAKAEDSGRIGSFREIRTLIHSIAEQAPDNAARSLIEAASTIDVKHKIDEFEDHAPELLADVAVRACSTISGVLDQRAEPDESAAYKSWVFDIAHQVANTSKEDGVRISAAESSLLDRTKQALGL